MNIVSWLREGKITKEQYNSLLRSIYRQVDYDPLPKQWKAVSNLVPFFILAGGVGSGKSLTSAEYAWPRCLVPSKVPKIPKAHYWIVAENYGLTKYEFTYMLEAFYQAGISITKEPRRPAEGSWGVEVNGNCVIETKSWTNPESLHGEAVQGMLVCEAGLLTPDIWHLRLMPRLARVPDSWCFWSGTLEESGHFYKDMVKQVIVDDEAPLGWDGVAMATWENTYIYPGGLEDPQIQQLLANTPHDIFMERYGAIPRTVSGLVYPEFAHTYHVSDFKWDVHQPVYLGIDPGGVYAVNVIQHNRDGIDIIDEIHMEKTTTGKVIAEAKNRDWWPNVNSGVIDATQDEQRRDWREHISIFSKKVPIDAGIELVRSKLHSGDYNRETTLPDSIWTHQSKRGVAKIRIHPSCTNIIYEMSQGYKYNKLRSGVYDIKVRKRDNHHCDALAYLLAHLYGIRPTRAQRQSVPIQWMEQRPISIATP